MRLLIHNGENTYKDYTSLSYLEKGDIKYVYIIIKSILT